jgi:hypothetical protein
MLVRRDAFEQAGGFDPAFRNCLEDVDLCLKIGESGREVHYCHQSVLYHLESVSRGRRSKEIERNARIFRDRWGDRAPRDDLSYYIADGMLRIRYRDVYPVGLEVSPLLALAAGGNESETERLLETQSREIVDLLRETIRLTAHVADLELAGGKPVVPAETRAANGADTERSQASGSRAAHARLLERARELELEVYDMQTQLAASPNGVAGDGGGTGFTASEQLHYKQILSSIRAAVERATPPGSVIVVISRGDEELTTFGERTGWHFPQDADRTYQGHHPATGREAVEQLEALRSQGAGFLLVPATAGWWLEHYADFGRHVRERYDQVTASCDEFELFRLSTAEDEA